LGKVLEGLKGRLSLWVGGRKGLSQAFNLVGQLGLEILDGSTTVGMLVYPQKYRRSGKIIPTAGDTVSW